MSEFLLYFSALFIGILLGMTGGGGSILTVPLFVYVVGFSPIIATGYSLFVVGTTSLVGALTYARKKLLNVPIAVTFFIPSFVAVFLVRRYLLPSIPEDLFHIGSFEVTRSIGIMIFFAVAMLAAAISMLRSSPVSEESQEIHKVNYVLFFIQALLVGLITGIAGAGGGFLIVPTLVLLAHVKMRLAVGTSLLIIAINSLIGFSGDLKTVNNIDWFFLVLFSTIAISGIFIGSFLADKVSGKHLKRGFGWFILIMSIVIVFIELYK